MSVDGQAMKVRECYLSLLRQRWNNETSQFTSKAQKQNIIALFAQNNNSLRNIENKTKVQL